MKITKRQLKRIIKEEKRKILKEYWGENIDTGSDVIAFAQAYCGLGNAVQSQVDAIIAAYYGGSDPDLRGDAEFTNTVYEQNPNAIDLAIQRLPHYGGEEIEEIIEALKAAQEIFMQGDAEVEADAEAAGYDPSDDDPLVPRNKETH